MPDREQKAKHPLLAIAAYVLVPGERRVWAMSHFKRAGVEALRGVGALAPVGRARRSTEAPRREHIDIE